MGKAKLLTLACVAFGTCAIWGEPAWPAETREMRPWCYHWWMGNAVDAAGIEHMSQELQAAGFGGFHVIPIYEVKDTKYSPIDYLSGKWCDAWRSAVSIGKSHELGADLSMGCGWCFGGPWISSEHGVWTLQRETDPRRVRKNAKRLWEGKDAKGHNVILAAYPTGQQVKRPPKSGRGLMLDPFSPDAMREHLAPFAKVFDQPGVPKPRAFYHDSYEYFGSAWTPKIFEAFKVKRGYDLREHLAALAGVGSEDEIRRVKHDYRETLSDLLLDTFTIWRDWCRKRGIITRNQAHGGPVNWLDFYALADIPETEMFNTDRDVLVSKFASSAAHLKNTPLVASESCTWIAEHFHETLDATQMFLNQLLLSGVNHAYYHGCCYSPADAAWPGWCFYASMEMNPRNPIWRDAPILNKWLTRTQSLAQTSTPDEDVLIYWPIHDFWRRVDGFAQLFTVHNAKEWFNSVPLGQLARRLYDQGVSFDYVSDRQLAQLPPAAQARWKTIVVPKSVTMPYTTGETLAALSAKGYRILFEGPRPAEVPGWKDVAEGRRRLAAALAKIPVAKFENCGRAEPFNSANGLAHRRFRRGNDTLYFVVANGNRNVDGWFALSGATWLLDPMTGAITAAPQSEGKVHLKLAAGESLWLWCTPGKTNDGGSALVGLAPRTSRSAEGVRCLDKTVPSLCVLPGPWKLTPICGGPDLKAGWPRTMTQLSSWARLPDGKENPFCGTVSYETRFTWHGELPEVVTLDLGKVCHSARVKLNGQDVGTRIRAPYCLPLPKGALRVGENVLVVEVTSTGANRIRDLDQRKQPWKIFTDINMVDINYRPMDASRWPLEDAGLMGPVRLISSQSTPPTGTTGVSPVACAPATGTTGVSPVACAPATGTTGVSPVASAVLTLSDGSRLPMGAPDTLQRAIDQLSAKGGGKISIPAGEWQTKPILLKSNITLELSEGTVLKGSTKLEDYANPKVPGTSRAFVEAEGAENIAIIGKGRFDGQGEGFVEHYANGAAQPKVAPKMMKFAHCRKVRLEDFTYGNSGSWGIHLMASDGVEVRRLKCYNHFNRCNDGIDIESRNVLIEDCDIDSMDDALCFKSESEPSFIIENVTVRNCRLASTCNFIKFGTGSYGHWKNILIEKCYLHRADKVTRHKWKKAGMCGVKADVSGLAGIALEVVDGGTMENVTVRDITMDGGVGTPLFVRFASRHAPKPGAQTYFRNVLVENVKMLKPAESRIASSITGLAGQRISGVTVRNCDFLFPGGGTAAEAKDLKVPDSPAGYPEFFMFGIRRALPAYGLYLRHAEGIKLENVNLRLSTPDARPPIYREDCVNIP